MFCTDELTADILKKYKQNSFLINDSTTPSGHAHVGSLRGVILHDIIEDDLTDHHKKAIFQFGFDDFDPMDGLPVYIDKSYEKYMGMPLCNIPAPDGNSKSFADQYADEFKEVINYIEIKPRYYSTTDLYKQGKFNQSIKLVLDHAAEIRQIYKQVSGSDKGPDWYPLHVLCPKCGKIGTTRVFGWDGKEVEFKCEENLVEWAKGCGHKGKISPYDGHAKMPYKVEWPAKWSIMGIDIEGAGKDHTAAGGTRDVADRIYREVFKFEPPYNFSYEHILIGGAKMSSSKGLGATAKDMTDFLPASILRFLFIRTKYKRAIEFNPEGETIPLLYDEYDRAAKAYREDSNSDLARAFYFTEINLKQAFPEYLLRFSKIASMLQMSRVDIFEYARIEKGTQLTTTENEEIKNRIKVVQKWLTKFAPENAKFTVQDELPSMAKNLSAPQKDFLKKIAETISSQDKWAGKDLHQKIHEIKTELNIPPRDAFSAIYLAFLGKDSGPQAGWLLASLDQDFVISRLKIES